MLCSELILREWREFAFRGQLRSDVEEVEHESRMGVKLSVQEPKEVLTEFFTSLRSGDVEGKAKTESRLECRHFRKETFV